MFVPLYEAVYRRLAVGAGTRLLGVGCGSGLALLMATALGARVTGVDADPERRALARERLDPRTRDTGRVPTRHTGQGGPLEGGRGLPPNRGRAPGGGNVVGEAHALHGTADGPYTVVTALEPIGLGTDLDAVVESLTAAIRLAEHQTPVVLTGWGPTERCTTPSVLATVARLAQASDGAASETDGDAALREVARRTGLVPDGSGEVSCPFGYADVDSAVRGLWSTGLLNAACEADRSLVEKELAEALQPYRRAGGAVWMPNVFRYLVTRTR
ncbi:methyltransferase domain-containing protein [Streptomyces sp. HSG2]|uniref:SAM-dependent methyltransferase n=1 Tax=Streptomyces sp. HSG2 TaxID=2797167 RepID=UPI001F5B20A8|nr:methyltransferase domain-containing protein [Streptomyces sp. HSG2]